MLSVINRIGNERLDTLTTADFLTINALYHDMPLDNHMQDRLNVGLSNILDNELNGGKPMEGSHRKVVGTGMMNGELLCKVIQRVEVVARIEALLILTVAALDFAVVPRRIRADQLVLDAQFGSRLFKQRL